MKKAIFASITIFCCFLLQTTLFAMFGIGGMRPNLLIIATASLGFLCGKKTGIYTGFFSGLLIDYAKQNDIHVSVRGLRAVTDFEYELQIAQTNSKFSGGELDTIFLTTSLEYAYLSSSTVKEIASFGGDISQTVPDFVAKKVYEKFGISERL